MVKTKDEFDADWDGLGSFTLAVEAAREKCVRSGSLSPRHGDAEEMRQAKEGPRPNDQLDCVRRDAAR